MEITIEDHYFNVGMLSKNFSEVSDLSFTGLDEFGSGNKEPREGSIPTEFAEKFEKSIIGGGGITIHDTKPFTKVSGTISVSRLVPHPSRLRREAHLGRSNVVVDLSVFDPMTAVSCRISGLPFTYASIPFTPIVVTVWWRCRHPRAGSAIRYLNNRNFLPVNISIPAEVSYLSTIPHSAESIKFSSFRTLSKNTFGMKRSG